MSREDRAEDRRPGRLTGSLGALASTCFAPVNKRKLWSHASCPLVTSPRNRYAGAAELWDVSALDARSIVE